MANFLCFVQFMGNSFDNYLIYNFYFTKNKNEFNIIDDNDPCCLTDTIKPITYDTVFTVKTKIKLDLIQDNCCFSFSHAKHRIVALAYENIDSYEEYPDDRIILFYGDEYSEVENKLGLRGILIMD